MGVAIALRKDKKKSFYKNILLDLMNTTDANEIVLCTGYLQSSSKNYNVFIDTDSNGNTLRDAILSYKKATIVGVKGDNTNPNDLWYNEFKKAADYMKSEKRRQQSLVDLKFYYHNSKHWHAKIAILIRNNAAGDLTPIAALVGSSNLTRPAFADGQTPNNMLPVKRVSALGYNLEADTLIYVDEIAAAVDTQLAMYSDVEYGAILSYSSMPQIYGSNTINSEADVIEAEYNDIMKDIKASGKYNKL